jgi:hypothetical protein
VAVAVKSSPHPLEQVVVFGEGAARRLNEATELVEVDADQLGASDGIEELGVVWPELLETSKDSLGWVWVELLVEDWVNQESLDGCPELGKKGPSVAILILEWRLIWLEEALEISVPLLQFWKSHSER